MSNEFDLLRELSKKVCLTAKQGTQQIKAGPNVKLENTGAGIRISATAPATAGSTGTRYRGPFGVVKKSDTSVTILGYNADAGRYFHNLIYLGTNVITTFAEQDVTEITTDGYLTVKITYSDASYNAEAYFCAESIPSQGNTEYYVPIAHIRASGSKIVKITQLQFGVIEGSGRVF